ncbi:MAG: hypothetical protein LBR26_13155 [Prevotella sp.]|jgi:hypothetical protein|nr:hypothetical protein [Prevotella sp.]
MEKEKFNRIDIPDQITDPEERKLIELMDRVVNLSQKKGWTIMLMACSPDNDRYDDDKRHVSIITGCDHCVANLIKGTLNHAPELADTLMSGVVSHLAGINNQILDHAKKITPAGN